MQAWKKTAHQNISKMTPEEAKETLASHRKHGVGIGDPTIRKITGGFSSQSIDMHVLRKLGIKAGYIKNSK